MKRRLRRFMLFALLLFTPLITFAVSGWTDYAPVAELTPTSRHRYMFILVGTDNPSGCKDKEVFYQDYAMVGSDHMFRTLLVAVESRKMVRVFVTGKCDLDGYSEISSVSIAP